MENKQIKKNLVPLSQKVTKKPEFKKKIVSPVKKILVPKEGKNIVKKNLSVKNNLKPVQSLVKKPISTNTSVPKKNITKKTLPVQNSQLVKKETIEKTLPKIAEPKYTKIEVLSVQDILNKVGNKVFIEIHNEIIKTNPDFFKKGFSGTFETKKELASFFKERIFDFFKERNDDIRSTITELRKAGKEVTYLDLRSLNLPFKMKVFLVHFTFEEFNKLNLLFKDVESFLKEIKDEYLLEQKKEREIEEEKMKRVREKNQKEEVQENVSKKKISVSPTKNLNKN